MGRVKAWPPNATIASACFFHGKAQLTLQEELYAEQGKTVFQTWDRAQPDGRYLHAQWPVWSCGGFFPTIANVSRTDAELQQALSLFHHSSAGASHFGCKAKTTEAEKLFLEAFARSRSKVWAR
jgi:hypothetical protein